jgi:hypothetical protein
MPIGMPMGPTTMVSAIFFLIVAEHAVQPRNCVLGLLESGQVRRHQLVLKREPVRQCRSATLSGHHRLSHLGHRADIAGFDPGQRD